MENSKATALITTAEQQVAEAREVKILTQADADEADGVLKKLSDLEKEIDTERRGRVDPLNAQVKEINAEYKPTTNRIGEAKTFVKRVIARHVQEQEAEGRRRTAEAEERARKEAAKLESRADKAEEKGRHEKADALRQDAVTVVPADTQGDAPKVTSGVRKVWKGEMTNKAELIKAAAENPAYLGLFDLNQSALDSMARAMKEHFAIPGAKAYQRTDIATRR